MCAGQLLLQQSVAAEPGSAADRPEPQRVPERTGSADTAKSSGASVFWKPKCPSPPRRAPLRPLSRQLFPYLDVRDGMRWMWGFCGEGVKWRLEGVHSNSV